MKFSGIITVAGMCAGLLTVAFSATAFAAVTPAPVAVASAATVVALNDCGLTADDVAQIGAIQSDPTLSATEEITKELAVRKQLIGKTISCAQADVQSLQKALAAAPVSGDAAAGIQTQLQGRLNDAAIFYTLELGKLNDAGISGSESIARDILAWRAGTYAPLLGQVNNFILWTGNQNLFSTAQTRMNQTQQAVSFFESASANTDLQNAFDAAYSSFRTAKSTNANAQAALAQSLPSDQSLLLIKQSLDALSDTYQKFFAVTDIIKTLLPQ
ncbi:MAG: hypothetical protein P4L67_02745 [Candidatus Pacebacteria bacterium]|nr:hypothetical protein [Candidatus Paceibacterota bacterium]